MKDAYNHRLRLVESAKQHGIKPAARLFTTTVPTVGKWLRRYQQHGHLRAADYLVPSNLENGITTEPLSLFWVTAAGATE